MKKINLLSIYDAQKTLKPEHLKRYLNHFTIILKTEEIEDLCILIELLIHKNCDPRIFNGYFIGFNIPQISKQFDLLRFSDNTIINIEIKKKFNLENIENQLIRNKYYLKALEKTVLNFTFVVEDLKLYTLSENNKLVSTTFKHLINSLIQQVPIKIKKLDELFKPTNYLVSPFNSTSKFIRDQYFLTSQQEEIKKNILTEINKVTYSILSINGQAGTGKTLLIYDIAKSLRKNINVLIIHCGKLNLGHQQLISDFEWNIISISYLKKTNISQYNLIIVDETQRIRPSQLTQIFIIIKNHNQNVIFSYDENQTLRTWETNNNIKAQIENELTFKPIELTTTIRTNKAIIAFVRNLFNCNSRIEKQNFKAIEFLYFSGIEQSIEYIFTIKDNEWKIINFTPSRYNVFPYDFYSLEEEPDNAHTVIGQEFDNVVAIIDEYFYYNDKRLSTHNYKNKPYYHPTKMLYQILSRARNKLKLIIINNPEILNRCIEITENNYTQ